jgi:hypothetical protein
MRLEKLAIFRIPHNILVIRTTLDSLSYYSCFFKLRVWSVPYITRPLLLRTRQIVSLSWTAGIPISLLSSLVAY